MVHDVPMSKRMTHELTYDAPVDRVAAMLADPAFREEVTLAQGAVRHEVSSDDGHVVIDQVRPARGLPSFVTKLVGDEINIRQEERWTSETEGDIEVRVPGKPAEMSGKVRLIAEGDGTREHVELDIAVKIPLVGGKLEAFLADLMVKALKVENRVGREYLAR